MYEKEPFVALSNKRIIHLVTNPVKNFEPRKKLIDFSNRAKKMNLTSQEVVHLRAAQALAAEDWVGAMEQYESILERAPLDMYALHMAYFLAAMSGHTKHLRDIPASVIEEYKPGMPYYGYVRIAMFNCSFKSVPQGVSIVNSGAI